MLEREMLKQIYLRNCIGLGVTPKQSVKLLGKNVQLSPEDMTWYEKNKLGGEPTPYEVFAIWLLNDAPFTVIALDDGRSLTLKELVREELSKPKVTFQYIRKLADQIFDIAAGNWMAFMPTVVDQETPSAPHIEGGQFYSGPDSRLKVGRTVTLPFLRSTIKLILESMRLGAH